MIKQRLSRRSLQRYQRWTEGLPIFIFLLLLLMAAILSGLIAHYTRQQQQARFEREVTAHTAALQGRIEDFDKLLRDTRAFWLSDPEDVTPERFAFFSEKLELEKRYPDIEALGFGALIPRGQEDALETLMASLEVKNYTIYPKITQQNHRVPIIFTAPRNKANEATLGFDMLSDTGTKNAILRSIRVDSYQITRPLNLLQENKKETFLVYLPVWREEGMTTIYSADSQPNLDNTIGFLYVSVRAKDFLKEIEKAYNGKGISQSVLLDNYPLIDGPGNKSPDDFSLKNQLFLGGVNWKIQYCAPPRFGSDIFSLAPFLIFTLGFIVSVAAYIMTSAQLLARSRTESINEELRKEQVKKEKARAEFEAIFQSMQDAAVFTDKEGRIRRVNRALLLQFGYQANELEGAPLSELHIDPLSDDVSQVTTLYQRRNGLTFQGETQRAPVIHAGGEPLGVLEVIRDVTDKLESDRALRKAEKRLREVLDTMPHVVWVSDQKGEVTYINEQHRRRLGGLSVRESVIPEDMTHYDEMWATAYHRGVAAYSEVRLCTEEDEEPRWFEVNVCPVGDGEWVASATDIHDRLVAERLAQSNEMRYRGILEGLPQIVWLADINGEIRYLNRRWKEYVGADYARPFINLIHPDDRPRFLELWHEAVKQAEPFQDEHRLLGHDGIYHHFVTRALPMFDDEGKVIEWIGTSTDVDDSLYAELAATLLANLTGELAVREANPLVRTDKYRRVLKLLEEADITSALWDGTGSLLAVSSDQWHLTGLQPLIKPLIERVLETREPLENTSAEWYPLAAETLHLLPLTGSDGGLLGVLGLATRGQVRDREYELMNEISQRLSQAFDNDHLRIRAQTARQALINLNSSLETRVKTRTAELEEANRELEAFSYSVSHDLRTPLRHISGYTDMLSRETNGKLSAKGERSLQVISEAVQRMNSLIESLLEFSRMGRAPLRMIAVDLEALVSRVWDNLETEREGRSIIFEISGRLPTVQGDPTLLDFAFQNLLSNAIKYTRYKEEAHIHLRVDYGEEEVSLSVSDNGAGFDPAYTAKLFGVFQRLHRSDEFDGTGIGLANVRRIILRHGGRIRAEGAVGIGATFTVTLPLGNATLIEEEKNHD